MKKEEMTKYVMKPHPFSSFFFFMIISFVFVVHFIWDPFFILRVVNQTDDSKALNEHCCSLDFASKTSGFFATCLLPSVRIHYITFILLARIVDYFNDFALFFSLILFPSTYLFFFFLLFLLLKHFFFFSCMAVNMRQHCMLISACLNPATKSSYRQFSKVA